ncbi:hypothetical protein BGZ93_008330 [Podila epicladia]|nr:hypothetical protein BGZ93_008330 [Podila epicladia]
MLSPTPTRVPGQMQQLQTWNELLPWRGLSRMRRFEMVVNWIGYLREKDFAFLASQEGVGTVDAKSCSSGPLVSEIKDVFWPKLQEFVLAVDPLHLGGMGDEDARREDVQYLRSNQMQRALARLRPQVAFVFGYEGWI